MEIVTITRNLDEVSVNLLAQIAEHDAEYNTPNESATLRRLIREEAERLNLKPTVTKSRTKQVASARP